MTLFHGSLILQEFRVFEVSKGERLHRISRSAGGEPEKDTKIKAQNATNNTFIKFTFVFPFILYFLFVCSLYHLHLLLQSVIISHYFFEYKVPEMLEHIFSRTNTQGFEYTWVLYVLLHIKLKMHFLFELSSPYTQMGKMQQHPVSHSSFQTTRQEYIIHVYDRTERCP